MDDVYSFLFFIAIIVINIVFQNAKKKSRRTKQKLPPIEPPKDLPNRQENLPSAENRTLDYMMAKPKAENNKKDTTVIYTEPEFIKEEREPQFSNVYQEYLKQKEAHLRREAETDYMQSTKTQSDDTKKKMQIDIAHEHIMNAIMYAQVLETPKSIHYLKRYGIRRIIHKD